MVKISRYFLITFSLIITIYSAGGQSPVFPHGFAPWELSEDMDFTGNRIITGFTTPPQSSVRASAEWEEIDALMVTWTDYISTVREIVRYARKECKVYIVCSDSISVKDNLVSNAISLENIFYLQEDYNSIWCRDYGQWNVYQNNADSLFLIDWIYNRSFRPLDDIIPGVIAEFTSLPIYQTVLPPYDFVATGGNFMTDGWGTGFSSNLILDENDGTGLSLEAKTVEEIDTIVKRFMGIDRYIKMETLPYDEIHHIDMHLKLLDEETLLVGEYPTGIADGPQIEANLNYILDNYTSIFGTPYKVVRIPMPPDGSNGYPDAGGAYRTYTNCVFVNKTVLVPVYEDLPAPDIARHRAADRSDRARRVLDDRRLSVGRQDRLQKPVGQDRAARGASRSEPVAARHALPGAERCAGQRQQFRHPSAERRCNCDDRRQRRAVQHRPDAHRARGQPTLAGSAHPGRPVVAATALVLAGARLCPGHRQPRGRGHGDRLGREPRQDPARHRAPHRRPHPRLAVRQRRARPLPPSRRTQRQRQRHLHQSPRPE